MKTTLSKSIYAEQFSFLPGRQILDDVGILQESLHSIKKNNFGDFILKIDLEKAYDILDWTFLCLVLS